MFVICFVSLIFNVVEQFLCGFTSHVGLVVNSATCVSAKATLLTCLYFLHAKRTNCISYRQVSFSAVVVTLAASTIIKLASYSIQFVSNIDFYSCD